MEKLQMELGKKFRFLTIIEEVEKNKRKHLKRRSFLCKCDCGNVKEVNLIHLTQGDVVSCGCYIPALNKARTREKNVNWKGGRIIHEGYVALYLPEHPRAKSNGYVLEHIIVIEKKLNRVLIKGENVHHINGVKDDNRPENLELWSTSQPCGQRVIDKINWAKEILELYKDFKENE